MPASKKDSGKKSQNAGVSSEGTDVVFTLRYWQIRGLAAPLRMALAYALGPPALSDVTRGVRCWKDASYLRQGGKGVNVPECSIAWYKLDKPDLFLENPLANLPLVEMDKPGGKRRVVSQSIACELFLTQELYPEVKDMVDAAQVLAEIHDVRDMFVRLCYGPQANFDANKTNHMNNVRRNFAKLEAWLAPASSEPGAKRKRDEGSSLYLLKTSTPTPADFHLFEMIDQHMTFASSHKIDFDVTTEFPNLGRLHEAIKRDPKLKAAYFDSDAASYPINNPQANFF